MKWSNVLRWIALPIVVFLVALFTDGLIRWLLGILISNHEIWDVVSQSVSNIACGIIVVVTAYHIAPKAKMAVASVTTLIFESLLGAITSLVLIIGCENQSSADWLILLTYLIAPLIGYMITKVADSVDNCAIW